MKKFIITIIFILLLQTITFGRYTDFYITDYGIGVETAYVTWYGNFDDYSVYYKKEADNEYKEVDYSLIINSRCDLPFLDGNETYDIKVIPFCGDYEEVTLAQKIKVTPIKALREGFAFINEENYVTGGYEKDRSIDKDTHIFYLTQDNCRFINEEIKKKTSNEKMIIRVIGDIKLTDSITLNSNTTIEGIGNNPTLRYGGIDISGSADENIEIRNLNFTEVYNDCISISSGAKRIFIHNNNFSYSGDGACDIVKGSDLVTFSQNILDSTQKSILIGNNDLRTEDSNSLKVSIHHNKFRETYERTPRIRYGKVHIYNNYYDNVKTYGVASTCEGHALVEGNYFYKTARPYIVSTQGNAILPYDMENFDKYFQENFSYNPENYEYEENNWNLLTTSSKGYLKAVDNYIDESCTFHSNILDENRDGFNFNPRDYYDYVSETPQEAKVNIERNAGCISKSLFKTGDADNSQTITSLDASITLSYVMNKDFLPINKYSADITRDNEITSLDASTILSYVLNKDFNF